MDLPVDCGSMSVKRVYQTSPNGSANDRQVHIWHIVSRARDNDAAHNDNDGCASATSQQIDARVER